MLYKPQESFVGSSNIPLVFENVETNLEAQIAAAHQVGGNEES